MMIHRFDCGCSIDLRSKEPLAICPVHEIVEEVLRLYDELIEGSRKHG